MNNRYRLLLCFIALACANSIAYFFMEVTLSEYAERTFFQFIALTCAAIWIEE